MSNSSHPHIEQLKDYLSDPSLPDSRELRLHLAQCPSCRASVNTLSVMARHLEQVRSDEYHNSTESDPDLVNMLEDQLIEQFVDGRLSGAEQQLVQTRIAEQPMALKAALHYTTHSAAMERELKDRQQSSRADETRTSRFSSKQVIKFMWTAFKTWFSYRSPAWITIPATALATGLLIFTLLAFNQSVTPAVTVASYRDNSVLELQPQQGTPGLGFFTSAQKKVMPFGNVRIAYIGKETIKLSWPAVPQTKSYTMRLGAFANGTKITLAEKTTTDPTVTFQGLEIIFGRRYVWELSGETENSESFVAKGGFVFDQH